MVTTCRSQTEFPGTSARVYVCVSVRARARSVEFSKVNALELVEHCCNHVGNAPMLRRYIDTIGPGALATREVAR